MQFQKGLLFSLLHHPLLYKCSFLEKCPTASNIKTLYIFMGLIVLNDIFAQAYVISL